MAFYDKFPYTNFQEINLDKLIIKMLQLELEQKEFINNNVIKYADPIGWDITTQYEANTVVTDVNGNAYISSQPVPAGVNITNTDYWSKIGNFDALYKDIKDAITTADEGAGTTATAARAVNDLVWLQDNLVIVTAPMIPGDSYVIGSNCENTDIDDELKKVFTRMDTLVDYVDDSVQDAKDYVDDKIQALPEFPTPEVFGAKGDGVTDDTAAFIALINHCKSTGVKCYIPNNNYQLNQNLLFDSSLIVSNGGIFPNKKIFTNGTHTAEFEYIVESKLAAVSDFLGSYAGYYLQACCENPLNGKIVIGFTNDSDGLLVEVDTDFTVSRRIPGALGHLNDITYNPIRRSFFCAPGGQGANANKLIEVDATTLNIINTFDLGYPQEAKWHVAYDPESESIIASDYSMQWFCDASDLSVYAMTNIDYKQNNLMNVIMQNSFVDEGKLYTVSFPAAGFTDFYFNTYDFNSEVIAHSQTLQNFTNAFELEGTYRINNKLYALATEGSNIFLLTLFDKTQERYYINDNIGKAGYVLSTENLDTMFGTGSYACRNATVAGQLGGSVPFNKNAGFSLSIENVGWRGTRQTAEMVDGYIMTRTFNPDISSWYPWRLAKPLTFHSDSVSVPANGTVDCDFPLENVLGYVPNAVATLSIDSGQIRVGSMSAVIANINLSRVKVRIHNNSDFATSVTVYVMVM